MPYFPCLVAGRRSQFGSRKVLLRMSVCTGVLEYWSTRVSKVVSGVRKELRFKTTSTIASQCQ